MSKILAVTEYYNEVKNIPGLVESVSQQTILPMKWLIINDGSKDNSTEIFIESLEAHDLSYELVEMPPKAKPDANLKGVAFQDIEILNPKLSSPSEFNFVIKLDADTRLPSYYTEFCQRVMEWFPEIGVMAGRIIGEKGGQIPMGTGKFVRWDVVRTTANNYWDLDPDTLWNIKSVMTGMRLLIVEDLLLSVTRPTQISGPRGIYDYGRRMYYIKTHPLLVFYEALGLLKKESSMVQFLRGYIHELARGEWQFDDPDVHYFYGFKHRLLYIIGMLPEVEKTVITKLGLDQSEDVLEPRFLENVRLQLKRVLRS